MKTLVVVDVQYDFASPNGALYVKGGEKIADKVLEIIDQFDKVVFTMDFHPVNHCSFKENGGIWPVHCVAYTAGTALPMELLRAARSYEVALKGQSPEREEYGGFADGKPVASITEADEVVVCGIAGDYCVGETLRNIVKMRGSSEGVKAYWDGTAFFDGGIRYSEISAELGVERW